MEKSSKKQINFSSDEIKIVHIIPNLTDEERTITKKRIGNDIYEIFLRMFETIKNDNESQSPDNESYS